MFALVAAVILFLHGLSALDNSDSVNWLVIGLAFWALQFAWPVVGTWISDRRAR